MPNSSDASVYGILAATATGRGSAGESHHEGALPVVLISHRGLTRGGTAADAGQRKSGIRRVRRACGEVRPSRGAVFGVLRRPRRLDHQPLVRAGRGGLWPGQRRAVGPAVLRAATRVRLRRNGPRVRHRPKQHHPRQLQYPARGRRREAVLRAGRRRVRCGAPTQYRAQRCAVHAHGRGRQLPMGHGRGHPESQA